jgi:hypothetical protein
MEITVCNATFWDNFPHLLTEQFLWHAESKPPRFTAEASELPGLYFEKGFSLTSSRTGKSVCAVPLRVERSKEGKIEAWVFQVAGVHLVDHPSLKGVEIVIFND